MGHDKIVRAPPSLMLDEPGEPVEEEDDISVPPVASASSIASRMSVSM